MKRDPAAHALDRASPALRALIALVQTAYGDKTLGSTAVAAALELQGENRLPETPVEVMRFLRSHLLGILTEEIGPRLTMAVVDDLLEQLTLTGELPSGSSPTLPPVSAPRAVRVGRVSSRLRRQSSPPVPDGEDTRQSTAPPMAGLPDRVALIDADRIGRTALARTLVRAGCEVILVDSVKDLEAAIEAGDHIAAALLDDRHPRATEILRALARVRPEAIVVVRGQDLTRAREMVESCGLGDVRVRSDDTSATDLVDALRREES